jgi:hypothetical protein
MSLRWNIHSERGGVGCVGTTVGYKVENVEGSGAQDGENDGEETGGRRRAEVRVDVLEGRTMCCCPLSAVFQPKSMPDLSMSTWSLIYFILF